MNIIRKDDIDDWLKQNGLSINGVNNLFMELIKRSLKNIVSNHNVEFEMLVLKKLCCIFDLDVSYLLKKSKQLNKRK